MDSGSFYKSSLVKNAFAVITDIFSESFVKISLGLTDLIEVLFVAGIIICILIVLFVQIIQSQIIKNKYKGNEVLLLIHKILRRAYLFFYFITIRYFVEIINIQIVVLDIVWHEILAFSIIILSWLFISVNE